MARTSRRIPINETTRLMLQAKTFNAISVRTFVSLRVRKWVCPDRAERVFDSAAAKRHRIDVLAQPLAHRVDQMLVLPSGDLAFRACGAWLCNGQSVL